MSASLSLYGGSLTFINMFDTNATPLKPFIRVKRKPPYLSGLGLNVSSLVLSLLLLFGALGLALGLL